VAVRKIGRTIAAHHGEIFYTGHGPFDRPLGIVKQAKKRRRARPAATSSLPAEERVRKPRFTEVKRFNVFSRLEDEL